MKKIVVIFIVSVFSLGRTVHHNPLDRGIWHDHFVEDVMMEQYKAIVTNPTVYDPSLEKINENLRHLHQTATDVVVHKQKREIPIPSITHKIWLTDAKKPKKIPPKVVNRMVLAYENLKNFTHFIWTNHPDSVAQAVDVFRKKGFKIQVHHIAELKAEPCSWITPMHIKCGYFAWASDIVRLQVLAKYGGIYSDIGWIVRYPIIALMPYYDMISNNFSDGNMGHAVIACKAGNKVLQALLIQNDAKDFHQKMMPLTHVRQITELFCPKAITLMAAQLLKGDDRLLIVSKKSGILKKDKGLGSWHKIKGDDFLKDFQDVVKAD